MSTIDIEVKDPDVQRFLSKFHVPPISATSALFLFAAVLKENGHDAFRRDEMLLLIERCRRQGIHRDMLKEFKFKDTGIFKYSNDFDEAVQMGKITGLFTTPSPGVDPRIDIHGFDCQDIIDQYHEFYFPMLHLMEMAGYKVCETNPNLEEYQSYVLEQQKLQAQRLATVVRKRSKSLCK